MIDANLVHSLIHHTRRSEQAIGIDFDSQIVFALYGCLEDLAKEEAKKLYKKNIEKLVGMLKSDGHIDDDMIIDANAIAKGAIDATRGGKIRESDCDGAISYLGSIGMLNELN